jgi:hypothetical protein
MGKHATCVLALPYQYGPYNEYGLLLVLGAGESPLPLPLLSPGPRIPPGVGQYD